MTAVARKAIEVSRSLCDSAGRLHFSGPVAHVYNPLSYAWRIHADYLARYGASRKRVLFLGMNPGPWGMAQTGVPFGEVAAVRDWMGLSGEVDVPPVTHEKRPVEGLSCSRSEVSGRRLWGLFAERFGSAERFFDDAIVLNYCPLLFLEKSGRNRTPDKLPVGERDPLLRLCDVALAEFVELFAPSFLVAVGGFAENRAHRLFSARSESLSARSESLSARSESPEIVRILHPSPASPRANRDWSGEATRTLEQAGVWPGV